MTPASLPIENDDGAVIGRLIPISQSTLSDKAAIQALTDWRNRNADCFFTQFTATPDRTERWIRGALLGREDQKLFLIYHGDQLVGHFGFKDLTGETALLDNAMLGVRCDYPKIMVKAGRALVRWLFDEVGVTTVFGAVFADNVPALMMNKEIGFRTASKVFLKRESTVDGASWVEAAEGGDKKCYKIEMTRADLK